MGMPPTVADMLLASSMVIDARTRDGLDRPRFYAGAVRSLGKGIVLFEFDQSCVQARLRSTIIEGHLASAHCSEATRPCTVRPSPPGTDPCDPD